MGDCKPSRVARSQKGGFGLPTAAHQYCNDGLWGAADIWCDNLRNPLTTVETGVWPSLETSRAFHLHFAGAVLRFSPLPHLHRVHSMSAYLQRATGVAKQAAEVVKTRVLPPAVEYYNTTMAKNAEYVVKDPVAVSKLGKQFVYSHLAR